MRPQEGSNVCVKLLRFANAMVLEEISFNLIALF